MKYGLVAVLGIFGITAVFGQEFRGAISGAVTDPQGATVSGVKVVATEVRTGVKTQTVTDAAGQYNIPFLAPGDYQLSATMTGFKAFVQKNLHLDSGDHPTIDIHLEVGNTTQSVEVTADIPLLNTQNGTVGDIITSKEVEDLPLNGRTPLMLAQLAIGVTATAEPTLVHPFDLGAPAAFSVTGTPSQYSELLLDGVPDETWDGRAAYNPPQDAVQQVVVKAFDSDASFGHTGGGTMNQILKTGTNSLHGSAWEFDQPSDMVANDFFRNRSGEPLQITHFNQWGVAAGGPVLLPKFNGRNKLFWFFAYEGIKDAQPNPALLTVPTDAERQGNFSALLPAGTQYQLYDPNSAMLNGTTITRSPFPNNIIPTSELNPIALAYMNFYPQPNVTVGVSPIGVNNFSSNTTTPDNYNNELGRLDWNMTDRSRLSFDVRNAAETQTKNNYFNNPAEGTLLERNPIGATVDEVYAFNPTTVADVRLNFTRLSEIHGLSSTGYNPTTLGFPSYLASNSEYLQLPVVSLSTFESLGASGGSNWPSQSWQIFGDVIKTIGTHTIKFGVDARQYRMNFITYGNSTGTFSFGNTWVRASSSASSTVAQGQDLASFLLGLPTAGSYDLESYASFYQYYEAPFIQDDWRVTRTLTISAGLHYDADGPVNEKYGRTVDGFNTTTPNPIDSAAMAAYAKNPIPEIPVGQFNVPGGLEFASPGRPAVYQNTSNLVSPRLGVAWSPSMFHNKTVFRGGFGMFVAPVTIASLGVSDTYSTSPILAQEGFSQTTQMVPTSNNYLTPSATLSNPFPTGFVAPVGSAQGLATYNGQTINFMNPDMKNAYSLRWDADVEHTFGNNTMVEVAYIGNHSVHIPITFTQLNPIPAQYLSTLPVRDNTENSTLTATVANPMAGLLPNGGALNGSTTPLANLLVPFPQYPAGTAASGWSGSTGVIEQDLSLGRSFYESLNLRVERRLAKGLAGVANYSFSKYIEQDTWLNATDPVPEKRISPFDHPQHFVLAFAYELPVGKNRAMNINSRWMNAIFGGWTANSIYTWQIGPPLVWVNGSTTTPGDYVFYGGPGALAASYNNRETNTTANGVALASFNTSLFATNSSQTFAYHIRTFSTTFPNIRQDGLNEWDASLLKNIVFKEGRYLQLRFEAFNVINHPTFAAANLSATSSSFGVISSEANRPRTLQLGARIVF